MHHTFLLLLSLATVQASVFVTRTSSNDMHPSVMEIEVQLPETNKKIRIPLTKTEAFENIPVTLVENGASMTFSSHQIHHASHAHYRHIESKSVISVRTVNGIRRISGHVMHEGTSFFLEPLGETDHNVTKNTLNPEAMAKNIEIGVDIESRKKRQTNKGNTTYKVELHLLLDSTVWSAFTKLYGTDKEALTELHYYYTHILNGIDTAYRNIDTLSISVRCIAMTISKSSADDDWMAGSSPDASIILNKMIEYIFGETADHYMGFTRIDIHHGGKYSVCGVALLASICKKNRVSVIEDHGLHSWGTAAHELAHSLGSKHDGQGNRCRPSTKNLMAPSGGLYNEMDVANSYRFSSCSISYIADNLKALGPSNCLTSDQGSHLTHLASDTRQGTRVTLDQVCRLAYPDSPGKYLSSDKLSGKPTSICASIFCETRPGMGSSKSGLRAPVGTPCGDKRSCNWNGECTSDDSAPTTTDPTNMSNGTCSMDIFRHCDLMKIKIMKKRMSCNEKIKRDCCKTLATLC